LFSQNHLARYGSSGARWSGSCSRKDLSLDPPEDDDKLWDLRDATRGPDGQAWDVVVIKIHRDTARLVMNFVSGDAAEIWRIRPENVAHVAEALRPRPEDFRAS